MVQLIPDLSKCAEPVLIRLTLWEEGRYAKSLHTHLVTAGHPFVIRNSLRDAFEPVFGTSGVYFELFVLPIDFNRLVKILQLGGVEEVLETQFEMRHLPNLFLRRRQQPADPTTPYLEFKLVLNLLPRWTPPDEETSSETLIDRPWPGAADTVNRKSPC